MKKSQDGLQIAGVALTGPGLYTLDEIRELHTNIARQIWPSIRNGEEAEQRIKEWLATSKYLDPLAIRKLPIVAVTRWLEAEAAKLNPVDSGQQSGQSKKIVPDNPDVSRLANKINRERGTNPSMLGIARDFTNGDEKRAKSLLRQVRRYPHLLK